MKRPFPVSKIVAIAILAFSVSLISGKICAQADSVPIFKQHPIIPDFKLMLADSSFFQVKDKVDKKRPTVVIIFSPTCGHCQHQAEEITGHMKELQDINFIFSTAYPIGDMKQFIEAYGLDKFPNITVAHDNGYIMGTFYKISSLPGVFVYDKRGRLIANFETNVKAASISEALRN